MFLNYSTHSNFNTILEMDEPERMISIMGTTDE